MPQLNPEPWFMVLMSSWTIMLLMLMPLIIKASPLNPPARNTSTYNQSPWNWTWQ
uniref:ATP synthase complex subunit 8 n=1 Tax=Cyrtopodion scabrum TaxID=303590 RepID=A0A1Y1CC61_CYRSA|nr:ATP synthase F0 subunit 8 [Cyrtopodion scabrum]BAX77914.1 ATPase subunit8 [Cyrtopodion scabrum]